MVKGTKRHLKTFEWILLVIVVAALAVTLFYFVRDYAYLSGRGQLIGFHRTRNFRSMLLVPKHQMTPDQIQAWMTFHYLNRVFKLPDSYLQQQLKITDKDYPALTLQTWAGEKHQDAQALVSQVQSLIQTYQTQSGGGTK